MGTRNQWAVLGLALAVLTGVIFAFGEELFPHSRLALALAGMASSAAGLFCMARAIRA